MPFIKTADDVQLYYKDWGTGHPVVFSHGWPLNSDAWEDQMLFLANSGYRCIAMDRRGHGRSDQPWDGNNMDTYADDLKELVTQLNLSSVAHVGHSTGGGEVVRYVARHGAKHVSKIVLIGAVTPILMKTDSNPQGLPLSVFDEVRQSVQKDRSQFFQDFSPMFFGANRTGAKVSQGVLDSFWLNGMKAGLVGVYECIKAFSETDFSEDLRRIDVPTLIIHGDDDQIVPFETTARLTSQLVRGAQLKTYAGGSHGLCVTHKDSVNADLLDFLKD